MTATLSRFDATFIGDDWPKIDYAPPRYRTVPSQGKRDKELEHWALSVTGEAGLILDPWEEDVLLDSLRLRPDRKWGALEVGLCCPRQNGKNNLDLNTPLLTTDGWEDHESIRVGQYVYGSNGNPIRVVGRSEVFLKDRCYEVSFADGSAYVAGEGHLWHIWVPGAYNADVYALATGTSQEKRLSAKAGAWRTLTTSEIAANWGNNRRSGRNAYRYRVRCNAVLQTPQASLPLDPYIFGLWLGDGCKDKGTLAVGDEDRNYMRDALATAALEVYGELRGPTAWGIKFRIPGTRWRRNGFVGLLRQLGVYKNKHIPHCYLTASAPQRLALLQGLMDTDGSIGNQNKSSQVEFSTSIPALADTFHILARSLGIRVTPKWRETSRKPNCRFLWTPTFNPFRLPRKAEKYRPPSQSYRRADLMAITNVREVPSVPTRCIQVAASNGIYLVGRTFTPTHNSILEARELVALYVNEKKFPGLGARLTVHTAHEAKTAHESFERLQTLIEGTPRLRAKLRGKPRQSEGGEIIRLLDGRRIRFRTRTSGGGRGLSGDLLIFDEAMILMQGVHEAVWPIVTARENPQIWYAGSAVDKREPLMDEHGIVFSRVRKRGIGGDADLLYLEWSLPFENPDEVPQSVAADPEQWALANPGLDVRLSRRIIAVEQRSLSARGFARERLGVAEWPDPEQSNRVIDEEKWAAAYVSESVMRDPICFGVDANPGRSRATISVAGKNAAGKYQVEIVKRFRGTAGVVPTLLELVKLHGRRVEIVVEGAGPAGSLVPAMEREKLNVIPVTAGEHARGCGMFYDGVMGDPDSGREPTLVHLGDPALNAAVAGAVKRALGDRWAWNRKDSTIDISPLVAATLALYGFLRRRQSTPTVYGPNDFLGDEEETTTSFDDVDLPPLDEEDLL